MNITVTKIVCQEEQSLFKKQIEFWCIFQFIWVEINHAIFKIVQSHIRDKIPQKFEVKELYIKNLINKLKNL